ncbi:MAG: hypothetical protein U9N41_08285 [Euryarchaeota archaeon]|nr:hypothetical protein [Euryarchaeota archaeon]
MDTNIVIEIIIEALKKVNNPRFFKTERGYQGRFACAMYEVMDDKGIFPDDAILEEEYQKRLNEHGTGQRPDLIVHIPTEISGLANTSKNNLVVFAFKKNATLKKVGEDFYKLDVMFKELEYPLGIFINIGTLHTHIDKYRGNYKERLHFFSVVMKNVEVKIVHAFLKNGQIEKQNISG